MNYAPYKKSNILISFSELNPDFQSEIKTQVNLEREEKIYYYLYRKANYGEYDEIRLKTSFQDALELHKKSFAEIFTNQRIISCIPWPYFDRRALYTKRNLADFSEILVMSDHESISVLLMKPGDSYRVNNLAGIGRFAYNIQYNEDEFEVLRNTVNVLKTLDSQLKVKAQNSESFLKLLASNRFTFDGTFEPNYR